jgi:drug/metabolite transporter (DMT)-like permease
MNGNNMHSAYLSTQSVSKQSLWTLGLPLLFVFIYGSGFVGAKLGLLYSEPFTFLVFRFALAGLLLLVAAYLLDSVWPRHIGWLVLSGLLMQGVFSAGLFYALYLGMKPASSALIIALQPLLVTVLAGFYLNEQVTLQRWLGLLVGVVGVMLVVVDGFTAVESPTKELTAIALATEGNNWMNISCAVIALFGLSLGQLIQKKHCSDMNLISGGAVQILATVPPLLLLSWLFESGELVWHLELVVSMFWMAVGVSIGALSLLYIMLKQSSASQVASVFYGVPVTAALIAWPLFDQLPSSVDWLGFAIVVVGIWLANSSAKGKA